MKTNTQMIHKWHLLTATISILWGDQGEGKTSLISVDHYTTWGLKKGLSILHAHLKNSMNTYTEILARNTHTHSRRWGRFLALSTLPSTRVMTLLLEDTHTHAHAHTSSSALYRQSYCMLYICSILHDIGCVAFTNSWKTPTVTSLIMVWP